MPHYKDPYAPPLAPKVPMERPVWWPSWKEYKGRPEWYAELGYKDSDVRTGHTIGVMPFSNERDIRWMDPKVADGTSLVGPQGLDSFFHKDSSMKLDNVGNFYDYQRMIRENSGQYKQIAAKWEISKEHPGIAVNPLLNSIIRYDSDSLATNTSLIPSARMFFKYHLGPRFWDKPLNEGCLEKGFALAKYVVPISLLHHLLSAAQRQKMYGISYHTVDVLKSWVKQVAVRPMLYSFTFGLTACTSATIREKDDAWNWAAASSVVGLMHATLRNNTLQGFLLALVGSFLGFSYQVLRLHPAGFGRPINTMFSGMQFTGPLGWQQYPKQSTNTAEPGIIQKYLPP